MNTYDEFSALYDRIQNMSPQELRNHVHPGVAYVEGCMICSARDCPRGDVTHYDVDGCLCCDK